MENRKEVELHSEEVNDILSRPPKWIIRWGISVFFAIIFVLLTGSIFFRYPDIISSPVTVSSQNMPVHLKARVNGKLMKIFVKDSAEVTSGEPIAILETTTSYEDFLLLQGGCEVFRNVMEEDSVPMHKIFMDNMKLGSIQSYFSVFIKSLNDYNNFLDADYHAKKIQIINKQIKEQRAILSLGENQMKGLSEQYSLAKKGFERDSVLFVQKVISQADFEQSKIKRLTSYQSFENMQSTLANMRLGILQSEQAVFELYQEKRDMLLQLKNTLMGNFDNLNSQMEEWLQTYVLVSPVKGRVSYSRFWQENQNVSAGDIVITIVPWEKAGFTGKIYLPLQGAGKVKVDQKVNIKLDNFPYMEFGMVEGRIRSISSVPVEINGVKVLALDIDFVNGLISNYGKELNSGEEMSGTAEIITEDMSLFRRLFNPLRHLLKSRVM